MALIAGILVLLALGAAGAGVMAVRGHLGAALAVTAGFTVAGALAATNGRNTTVLGALPALVAGGVAAGVLGAGRRLARPPHPVGPAADAARRRLLVGAGGTAAGAVIAFSLGRALQRRFTAALERAGVRLPAAARPLAAPPADPAATVEGLSPLFTPNPRFFRIDTALVIPSVALDDWRLRVTGMVERERSWSYAELLARDLVEADVTIACVSNEVGGNLVGTARWLGVRLDELLAEAGVRPEADQVVGRSVDGFTAGFPVGVLDGRDALVAVGMNGEPLPLVHGFPARLVVPGLYGYVSATKWLAEIELTRFDRFEGYWIPRGWAARAPVKTQSRIDRPRRSVPAGRTAIAGVAWAPGSGIVAVEVRVDDGPWRAATLGPEVAATAWRQWWLDWDATPGRHTLTCRATDGTGVTQTGERRPPAPDGATGWHTVTVRVER